MYIWLCMVRVLACSDGVLLGWLMLCSSRLVVHARDFVDKKA